MILIDTNIFLRYFVQPVTSNDVSYASTARALFLAVRNDQESFTTSEAVIAEVVFILSSKRHYGIPRSDAAALLKELLQLRGCRLSRKQTILAALDMWVSQPKLSFVDSLMIVSAEHLDLSLASFDGEVNRALGNRRWQPSSFE